MNKIELKNLLFLARIRIEDKEHSKIIEKLTNTFDLIDEMNELDLEEVKPLNNPLELNNVSRKDSDNDRNAKKYFLENSPESDENYFIVPKIIE
ncbi:MAG: Asp-tRNA(Asn)/Glu-tRNA(Gln) amidotransferase GatCAB subunit C [Gammaproteobacteria bacterium]|nr:Asp-tRNA(Asn)/Glu-tRNA(Gln) amidotransferase GatCAB subunit C [Gammaproteobacteria bacterium]|tara:strand:- start:1223 stop:1504 length:282 start_codon:yes stop_codon:yes gene_type:complete